MEDYTIHYDHDSKQYWIGHVVRDNNGAALFIQQVGDYTPYKGVAARWLHNIAQQLNK